MGWGQGYGGVMSSQGGKRLSSSQQFWSSVLHLACDLPAIFLLPPSLFSSHHPSLPPCLSSLPPSVCVSLPPRLPASLSSQCSSGTYTFRAQSQESHKPPLNLSFAIYYYMCELGQVIELKLHLLNRVKNNTNLFGMF